MFEESNNSYIVRGKHGAKPKKLTPSKSFLLTLKARGWLSGYLFITTAQAKSIKHTNHSRRTRSLMVAPLLCCPPSMTEVLGASSLRGRLEGSCPDVRQQPDVMHQSAQPGRPQTVDFDVDQHPSMWCIRLISCLTGR